MKIKMYICPETNEEWFSIRKEPNWVIGDSRNLLILFNTEYKTRMNRRRIAKYQTLKERECRLKCV